MASYPATLPWLEPARPAPLLLESVRTGAAIQQANQRLAQSQQEANARFGMEQQRLNTEGEQAQQRMLQDQARLQVAQQYHEQTTDLARQRLKEASQANAAKLQQAQEMGAAKLQETRQYHEGMVKNAAQRAGMYQQYQVAKADLKTRHDNKEMSDKEYEAADLNLARQFATPDAALRSYQIRTPAKLPTTPQVSPSVAARILSEKPDWLTPEIQQGLVGVMQRGVPTNAPGATPPPPATSTAAPAPISRWDALKGIFNPGSLQALAAQRAKERAATATDTGTTADPTGLKEGQTVRNKKTGQLAIIRNGVPVPIPQTPAATEQPATADETDEEEP